MLAPGAHANLRIKSAGSFAEPRDPARHGIPDKEKSQRVDKQTFPALWKWPSGNQALEREGFSESSEVIFKEHSGLRR